MFHASYILFVVVASKAVFGSPTTNTVDVRTIPNKTSTAPLAGTTWILALCEELGCGDPCFFTSITTTSTLNVCNRKPFLSAGVTQNFGVPLPFKLLLGHNCPPTLAYPASELDGCIGVDMGDTYELQALD
ncbi:hypothetical protein SISNIDRAFT_467887 [Sistotremastrum niveocremeum HHB9708]|uniref:Uncharacterized protein n=1 Tax=Sistotremastrum niveocremeum HHB9708 TaxID=1314777 RepID=A0A164SBC3_9AGAM|nr:hypothetical protein SISNIDRAFT_467887 [Sistotremastrum niveocremeum HHB9708]